MIEATYVRDQDDRRVVLPASVGAAEIWQLRDGRAAYLNSLSGGSVGDQVAFSTTGQIVVPKASGVALLDGGKVYWDTANNVATYRRNNGRDFYLGRAVGDAAASDSSCTVNLNVQPDYSVDICRDAFVSVPVGTPAAGGFGFPLEVGGSWGLVLTATNEAQKVDLLSRDPILPAARPIVEFAFCVEDRGAASNPDFSIGLATGTHASDFQAIQSFAAISCVGNSFAINAQSDNDVTDINPTDTTLTFTQGVALANRVECWIDCRDPNSVKFYVNGQRVLPATTFAIKADAVHYLIAHLEKTASTATYRVWIDWLRARTADH
ncbi:MAG: hypothetical protein KatS3mg105_5017 [Gemmatales bacterium]|nr:MAG: hypothetical protein KatS3mg105_5017 [Gemmatales bacterium]